MAADVADQAAGLGDRDELIGGQATELRMPPPQQRLDGDQATAREVEPGLIGEVELAAFGGNRAPPPAGGGTPARNATPGSRGPPILARTLGEIESGVRGAQQRVGVPAMLGEDGGTDADRDLHPSVVQVERRPASIGQAHDSRRLATVAQVGRHQGELVAAFARTPGVGPRTASNGLIGEVRAGRSPAG